MSLWYVNSLKPELNLYWYKKTTNNKNKEIKKPDYKNLQKTKIIHKSKRIAQN